VFHHLSRHHHYHHLACFLLGPGRKHKKAKVLHEYKAENPDELNLEVGQVIEVLKQVFDALSVVMIWCMAFEF